MAICIAIYRAQEDSNSLYVKWCLVENTAHTTRNGIFLPSGIVLFPYFVTLFLFRYHPLSVLSWGLALREQRVDFRILDEL